MSLAFKQIRVYLRGAIVVLVAVAVGLVVLKNRSHSVEFWFFGLTNPKEPINVVWLMLCTAAGTLIAWWTFSLAWSLWRDIRELRHVRAIERENIRQEQRAAELAERERRIDEKLDRAIKAGDDET